MIVYQNFPASRTILAKECAEALGLKEIPAALYDLGVNVSSLPRRSDDTEEMCVSISESSLLSMGLVYSHGSTLTFINTNGHTMVMPNADIIKEELSKCGYLICEYGSSKPRMVEKDQRSYKYDAELESHRAKCTLPADLVQKIIGEESNISVSKCGEHAYDVFDEKFYRGGLCSEAYCGEVATKLGLTTKEARTLISFHFGRPSLSNPGYGIRTLDDYLLYAETNDALSDKRYYADDGLYETFSKAQLAREEAMKKNQAQLESLFEYDENSLMPPPSHVK